MCRDTGKVIWHSDFIDVADEYGSLPDDIEDEERYVAIPDKRDLRPGKPLALEFVRARLPEQYQRVWQIFAHRGGYGRFKDLPERHDSLDAW